METFSRSQKYFHFKMDIHTTIMGRYLNLKAIYILRYCEFCNKFNTYPINKSKIIMYNTTCNVLSNYNREYNIIFIINFILNN